MPQSATHKLPVTCEVNSTSEFSVFQSFFDQIDEFVHVTGLASHEILYMNTAMKKYYNEPLGKKCYHLFHNQKSKCQYCVVDRMLNNEVHKPIIRIKKNSRIGFVLRCIHSTVFWVDGSHAKLCISNIRNKKQDHLRKNMTFANDLICDLQTTLKTIMELYPRHDKECLEKIVNQFQDTVLYYLHNLKLQETSTSQKKLMGKIENYVKTVSSPFMEKSAGKRDQLTPVESEVARLIAQNMTTKQISAALKVSKNTINTHRANIRKKLGLQKKNISLKKELAKLPGLFDVKND